MAESKTAWLARAYPTAADRLPAYTTISDLPVDPLYTPDDLPGWT